MIWLEFDVVVLCCVGRGGGGHNVGRHFAACIVQYLEWLRLPTLGSKQDANGRKQRGSKPSATGRTPHVMKGGLLRCAARKLRRNAILAGVLVETKVVILAACAPYIPPHSFGNVFRRMPCAPPEDLVIPTRDGITNGPFFSFRLVYVFVCMCAHASASPLQSPPPPLS